jgi:NitT/TauT family transport system substrate-binding protein
MRLSHLARLVALQARALVVAGLVAALAPALAVSDAHAQGAPDTLKVAIGQINNWENQAPTLGQDAGIFKKHGLVLETFGTAGAGETLQPVISGSADIGIGVGVAGVMRALATGAPVRILAPAFTGTTDLYWYVRADSTLKTLADATARNSIAYSTNGSSSHNIVLAFVDELGLKAKPTPTGTPPATLTAVMSGQIDIGWAAPPIAMQEVRDGKVRILAHGSDVPSLRDQTVRATIVNAEMLAKRPQVAARFVAAYRETVDWMYSDPKAVELYAKKLDRPVELIRDIIKDFYPKEVLQTDRIADMPGILRDAVKLKFLREPLTEAQLKEFVRTPPR